MIRVLSWPCLALLVLMLTPFSCAPAAKVPESSGSAKTVSLEAFRGAHAGSIAQVETDRPPPPVASEQAPDAADDEIESSTTPAPPSPSAAPVRLEPGEEIVLDSLVGQINGRPVFADAFFDPIDAEIRARRRQSTPLEFDAALKEIIGARLWTIVQSELILSQAQSRLTPEMQQGLFAWLQEREEDIISERGGSRAEAIEKLRSESGIGLDVALQETRDMALIRLLIDQEIEPRVIVSWKDVERAYEQRFEEFNPPGVARLARIYLDAERDAEKVEIVRRRLADGDDFQDVAEAVGMPNRGVFQSYRIGPTGLDDIQEPIIDLYRERLADLGPGETTPDFRQSLNSGREWIVWIHVLEIEQAARRSLYDPEVQLELRDQLMSRERFAEQNRYFNELLAEGISNDIEAMAQRLYQVALQRYAR